MVCASLLPTGVARGAVPSRPRPVAHARPTLLADVARGCCALALTASLLAPASQAKADFGAAPYATSPSPAVDASLRRLLCVACGWGDSIFTCGGEDGS